MIFFVLWQHNVGVKLSFITVILQLLMVYPPFGWLGTWLTVSHCSQMTGLTFCTSTELNSVSGGSETCVLGLCWQLDGPTAGCFAVRQLPMCINQGRTEDQKYEINPVDQLCVRVCVCVCPKPSKDLVWQAKIKHLEDKRHQRCDKGATGNTERLVTHQRASG